MDVEELKEQLEISGDKVEEKSGSEVEFDEEMIGYRSKEENEEKETLNTIPEPYQRTQVDDNQIELEAFDGKSQFEGLPIDESPLSKTLAVSFILATNAISTLSSLSASETTKSTPTIAASQPGATVRLNESTSPSLASTIILGLLKLIFGHVPYFIFRILSTTLSLTVTLDFWTVLYLSTFISLLSIIFYRFVYNEYKASYLHIDIAWNIHIQDCLLNLRLCKMLLT